jgi:hypothetical protein
MTVARRRQMARLEKLAAPRIEQIRVAKAQLEQKVAIRIYDDALMHAANLSLIILFGDPQIDQPLSNAWERCCHSASPLLLNSKVKENNLKNWGPPFDQDKAHYSAMCFRDIVMPQLAAPTEQEKFATIFRDAPLWLLWFTWADITMEALEIPPRDRAAVCRFRRPQDDFRRWPLLPSGKFENIQMSDAEIAELARKAKAMPKLRGIGLLEWKYRSVMEEVIMSQLDGRKD